MDVKGINKMSNLVRVIVLNFLIITISGCASDTIMPYVENAKKSYQDRTDFYYGLPCCSEIKDLVVTNFESELTFTMEENKSLIMLNGSQTNYLLFALPEEKGLYYYNVNSFEVDHKFSFIPRISSLDTDFNVINSTDPRFIGYRYENLVWDDTHFWLYFKIDTRKNKAKYLIIHQQEHVGTKFKAISKISYYVDSVVTNGIPISYGGTRAAISLSTLVSPSGVLRLRKLNFWDRPIYENVVFPL